MKPRTLQMSSLRHGHRVKLDDGRWGNVTGRSVAKAKLHSRGFITELPDRVMLWVMAGDETVYVEKLATDRMEVEPLQSDECNTLFAVQGGVE